MAKKPKKLDDFSDVIGHRGPGYYWLQDIHRHTGVPVMVTQWVKPDTWEVYRCGAWCPDKMEPYHNKRWYYLGPLLTGVGND